MLFAGALARRPVRYVWLCRQGRRSPGRFNPLLPWVWVVVFGQSLLAVYVLGADAGFQYYLLATIPPSFAQLDQPLLNRRCFVEIAEHEFARSRRSGHPLSVVLGDIDFFKRINDRHGHAAGDHVLQSVANLLQGGLRDYDSVARWGGEEFVVLLPETDASTAQVVVERLRETIAESHPSFEGRRLRSP